MIINLRGTSGAGKSHIVREVMSHFAVKMPEYIDGRKRPLLYRLYPGESVEVETPRAVVLGHYETPCGGCDTISVPKSLDFIYDLVRREDSAGFHVLYEGLIVESDVRRLAECHHEGRKVLVLALNTPVEVCLESVKQRRGERGDARELDPTNTVNRMPQIQKRMRRLREQGVDARWVSREEGLRLTLEALECPPE